MVQLGMLEKHRPKILGNNLFYSKAFVGGPTTQGQPATMTPRAVSSFRMELQGATQGPTIKVETCGHLGPKEAERDGGPSAQPHGPNSRARTELTHLSVPCGGNGMEPKTRDP